MVKAYRFDELQELVDSGLDNGQTPPT
jgi:hypothetical protein